MQSVRRTTVIEVGDELGVVLPPEVIARLDPKDLGEVSMTVTERAIVLTPSYTIKD